MCWHGRRNPDMVLTMKIPATSLLIGLGGAVCGCALFLLDTYVERVHGNDPRLHQYLEAVEFMLVGPGLGAIALLLAERVRNLRNAATLAEQAVREQRYLILGRLAASVAHEVRNPLHTLRLVVDELRIEQPVLRTHPLSLHIDQNLERIDRAVDLVYQLARPGTHDETAGDLVTVLKEALLTVKRRSDGHEFTLNDLPKRALVRCASSAMRIMVDNLLRNAVEATSSGTRIQLMLTRDDQQWVVTITNPGKLPGFTPPSGSMYSLSSAKVSGLGLGLAITRQLAENAGGQIGLLEQDGTVSARLVLPALEANT
jgi:two-component system sensor histidine kinase HydH